MADASMNLPRIVELKAFPDGRGNLLAVEIGDGLPFAAKRFFLIWADPRDATRGGHAQRTQSEFIVCTRGRAHVTLDTREGSRTYVLINSRCGVYVPPMTWCEVEVTRRSEIVVLSSGVYDEADAIRDRTEFETAHAEAVG